jgi:hypothetical protein
MSYKEHGEDIEFVIQSEFVSKGKKVPSNGFYDSDMGSDSDYHTDKSHLVLADIFQRHQMGVMIVGGPCSNNSAANDIESDWSPLKTSISGMIISDTVGTDTLAPDKQTDLNSEQMIAKDLAVFKNAGETLKRAWSRIRVGGNPVEVRYTLPEVSVLSRILLSLLM